MNSIQSNQIFESEPHIASDLFGTRIDLARKFATELVESGETLGLIGPQEIKRIWTRHILNCALLAPLLKNGSVCDVGSGAGFPGIVLAIMRPDLEFTLIEPMERRVIWLNQQSLKLGLENITVVRARAEEVKRKSFNQVTARAVSALKTLIPITAPLLRSGGELLLMKGSGVDAEITSAEKVIRKFQITEFNTIKLGEDLETEVTRVFRATVG